MAIKLGDINFGLGADTAALQKSMDKLAQFGQEVDKVSRRQSEGAAKVAAAYRQQEAAVTSALQKTLNLTNASRRAGADTAMIDKTTAAFNRYSQYVLGGERNALQMQRANERLKASLNGVNRELASFKAGKAASEAQSFAQMLRNLATTSTLALGPLGGVSSRIAAFASLASHASTSTAIFVAGMAASGIAIAKLGGSMVAAASKLNAVRMQFTAVTGAASLAGAAFNDVQRMASLSGQEFTSTASAYAKFMAASNGTSLAGQQAADIFQTVSLVAGKMNMTADESAGVFKALEQMMSKGTVQAEELRGQLGDRLPGAFNLMAKAMGVSTIELGKMMKAGDLLAEDALPKLAAQLKKTFNIDNTMIDTYPAAVNRLSNATTLFMDALDRSIGLSDALKATFNALANALTYLSNNMNILGQAVAAVAGTFIALNIGAIGAGFVRLAGFVATATKAMLALNIAVLANPFTGLLGLLARVAVAIAGATAGWLGMRAVMGQSGQFGSAQQELDDLTKGLKSAAGGMDYLAQKSRDAVTTEMFANQKKMFELQKQINDAQGKTQWSRGGAVPMDTTAAQEQLRQLEERQKSLNASMKANRAAMEENNKKIPQPTVPTGDDPTAKQLLQMENALARFNNQYEEYRTQNAAIRSGDFGALEQADKLAEYNEKMQQYKQLLEKTALSEEERAAALQRMGAALTENTELQEYAAKSMQAIKEANDTVSRGFDQVGASIADMAMDGEFSLKKLSDVVSDVCRDIYQSFFQLMITNPLKNALFGLTGANMAPTLGSNSLLSSLGSSIGSLFGFGGARAGGGRTKANRSYVVGENGPEIWSSDQDGHVTSNNAIRNIAKAESGGNGIQVNVNVNNNSQAQISTQSRQNESGGVDLEIIVDQVVARKMGTPGSGINQAMKQFNGQQLTKR